MLRVLVAIASPTDLGQYGLAPIDVKATLSALRAAMAGPRVKVIPLVGPACTLEKLEQRLRDDIHVLHFVGHGMYPLHAAHSGLAPAIFMADAANQVRRVAAPEFAEMLGRHLLQSRSSRLRLVVLSSCQSATTGSTAATGSDSGPGQLGALPGFAYTLVNAGVPAVVAMQDNIAISAASVYSAAFYEALVREGHVDLACSRARAALAVDPRPAK